MLLGLHAAARRLDRDQALLGALGVGAFAYTHQIDSVHRMVTGTACRWLLADEVGLGKTIQAIMVMRALAAQSPRPLTAALGRAGRSGVAMGRGTAVPRPCPSA